MFVDIYHRGVPVNRQWDVTFTGLLAHIFFGGQYWTTVVNPNPKNSTRDSEAKQAIFVRLSVDRQQIRRLEELGAPDFLIRKLKVVI